MQETIRLSLIGLGGMVCWFSASACSSPLRSFRCFRKKASSSPKTGALRLLALAYPLTGVAVITAVSFQSIGRAKEALLLTLSGIC
ncbi:MAG: hypothetical protein R3D55_17205 [Chloroflexota bacterium]